MAIANQIVMHCTDHTPTFHQKKSKFISKSATSATRDPTGTIGCKRIVCLYHMVMHIILQLQAELREAYELMFVIYQSYSKY